MGYFTQEQIQNTLKSVEEEKLAEVKEALETQPKLTLLKDKAGRSLLHIAVLTGNTKMVDFLISQNSSILTIRDNVSTAVKTKKKNMKY